MKNIATLGSIGYLPAPGTMATIIAWPAIAMVKAMASPQIEWLIIITLTLCAAVVIHNALQLWPLQADPPQVVLDEYVGFFVALQGISLGNWKAAWLGFFLFRLLDITKPLGIAYCERLPGAIGILSDDILAGIYTMIFLKILFL